MYHPTEALESSNEISRYRAADRTHLLGAGQL